MRIIALILAIYCAHKGTAQSLLNGSFEDNSLDTNSYCYIDMPYQTYDSTVFNSTTIKPVPSHRVRSMIYEDCIYPWSTDVWGGVPQEGQWFLMLYGAYYVWIANEFIEAQASISLALSAPLVVGKTYELSYYIQAYPSYPPYPSQIIEDQITGAGIDPDIGTSYLQVGISETDTSFGEWIHSSAMPPQGQWLKQSLNFNATLPAQHLSCRIFVPQESLDTVILKRYSLFVDNFVLSEPNSTASTTNSYSLYPNPTEGRVQLQHPTATQIVLHDLMGKEQHRQAVLPQHNNRLDLEHLPRGIYLLSYWHQGQQLHQQKLYKIR